MPDISIPGGSGGGSGGAAGELGYWQITSNFSTAGTADVTGLAGTVTVGSRPIVVTVYSPECRTNQNDTRAFVYLVDTTSGGTVQQAICTGQGADVGANMLNLRARLAPAAGSRSYKVTLVRVDPGGGSAIVRASTTAPAYLHICEV